jgi:hypothetical protein
VFFGSLYHSEGERRRRTCRAVADANMHTHERKNQKAGELNEVEVACFHEVHGGHKDQIVCGADVIFVEHYYSDASLEVHRINPLLRDGKVRKQCSQYCCRCCCS